MVLAEPIKKEMIRHGYPEVIEGRRGLKGQEPGVEGLLLNRLPHDTKDLVPVCFKSFCGWGSHEHTLQKRPLRSSRRPPTPRLIHPGTNPNKKEQPKTNQKPKTTKNKPKTTSFPQKNRVLITTETTRGVVRRRREPIMEGIEQQGISCCRALANCNLLLTRSIWSAAGDRGSAAANPPRR